MKITEITDNAAIKIKGLVNIFYHKYDLEFTEIHPNVFILDKEYYQVKIYGGTSVKVSIHTIGYKRDDIFTAKQPLECAKNVIAQVKKIELNGELLFEIFKRISGNKNIKINVDKNKGIFLLGKNKVRLKLLLWFTGIGQRLICEWPGTLIQRQTTQIEPRDIDYFITAASQVCEYGDYSYIELFDDDTSYRNRRELCTQHQEIEDPEQDPDLDFD